MSQFFALGGQSIGVLYSASVLPMNIQDWLPLGWTGWIFLQSKGLWRVFSFTTVEKHQFFSAQPSLWSNSHICTWLLEKPQLWLYEPLPATWCLCFVICCQVRHRFSSKIQVSFNFVTIPVLGPYMFTRFISFCWIYPLFIMQCLCLLFTVCLKSILSDVNIVSPAFLLLPYTLNTFSMPSHFLKFKIKYNMVIQKHLLQI